jgi:putative CocE/NonD family hydrolase
MKYSVLAYLNVRVPMRDGVELSTQVYLPATGGPFPVLLSRTPYDSSNRGDDLEWPGRGFACVRQDVRGKFRSDGEWYPWMNEKADGEDTLAWIAAQPWCNGSIAMYGGSYVSATQTAAAISGHPALKCFTPCLMGTDFYEANYRGGAFRLGWQTRWTLAPKLVSDQDEIRNHLPLEDTDVFSGGEVIPFWRDVLGHPLRDGFWEESSVSRHFDMVQAPAFIRTGWFDHFVGDVFDLFNGLRSCGGNETVRRFTRILVGPWAHSINVTTLDEVDFGEHGRLADLYEQEIAFLKHFVGLESDYDPATPPIRIYVMGADVWRDEYEWPLARTKWTDLFLSSGGQANTAGGDGRLGDSAEGPEDRFRYDPANPVPTVGGAWDFSNVGLRDQSVIEAREDVLVYASEELAEDIEVTGPVTVRLFASSSARDTDFTAKLVDLRADGKPMSVTDGIVRARYRKACSEELLEPGRVCEFTIECNPTSYVFKKGHRIRLEISSSNFPAFARNLNTGNDIATDREMLVADQVIYHSPEYPSRLILPVIPSEA